MFVIVMGVSGSGKSTVGKALAEKLGLTFYDADEFHASVNIEKMRAGIPLTDEDRQGWLDDLQKLIAEKAPAVLACSALKKVYRDQLRLSGELSFVYLKGTREVLQKRLEERTGHFMTATLLDSQLETLEEPLSALTVDASLPLEDIVEGLLEHFQGRTGSRA